MHHARTEIATYDSEVSSSEGEGFSSEREDSSSAGSLSEDEDECSALECEGSLSTSMTLFVRYNQAHGSSKEGNSNIP